MPVLGRPDPLPADLDDLAVPDVVVERAPADAVARLEHDRRRPAAPDGARRDQAGKPGADDDDVRLAVVGWAVGGAPSGHARQPRGSDPLSLLDQGV